MNLKAVQLPEQSVLTVGVHIKEAYLRDDGLVLLEYIDGEKRLRHSSRFLWLWPA